MLKMICAVALLAAAAGAQAEALIPRSAADKGTYYLLESKRKGAIVLAVHKRIGPNETAYTKTETNCGTMKMRQIGYSEESTQAISGTPTEWFDLVPGSSKSDVARFVCSQAR